MAVSHRKTRAAIHVSGADAQKLLNDVLTADVAAEDGAARWWALLSPQGKIQVEGLIVWDSEAFWLDVPVMVADAFLKRMRMYKLRASAEIEDLRESHVIGWSAEPVADGIVDMDPRGDGMGFRVIAPKEMAGDWNEDDTAFVETRIIAGFAELGDDFESDNVFPHDIGMDVLGGIDFAKGCYVGQEVVSRMQHRGTARRRPVIVSGVSAEAGAVVMCGGKEAGAIGRVVDGKAVAILRLDRVSDPEGATIDGNPVKLALPSWASYGFGDSAGSSTDEPN